MKHNHRDKRDPVSIRQNERVDLKGCPLASTHMPRVGVGVHMAPHTLSVSNTYMHKMNKQSRKQLKKMSNINL